MEQALSHRLQRTISDSVHREVLRGYRLVRREGKQFPSSIPPLPEGLSETRIDAAALPG